MMEPNGLYYYCKFSTAIEKILPKRQLLLNQIGKTNDPRENKDFVFGIESWNLLFDEAKVSQEIRDGCKMLCFSTDYGDLYGFEYSRMWALYGENHKGVCIELNKEKFIIENKNKISSGLFKRINYINLVTSLNESQRIINNDRIKKIGLRKYIRQEFRPKNIDYLFFTKNKEWESEQEYRLIYFSDNIENEYCSISDSLKSIYLGIDFNYNYLPSILNLVSGPDIYKLDYYGIRLVANKIN